MSYTQQNLTDGTVLTAAHLNHIDAGIAANETAVRALGAVLTAIDAMLHPTVYHSITANMTHCALTNAAARVEDGTGYTASLTADTHYELSSVSVTMGGTDITSTAYSNGTVSIQSVTGDVVITATATAITYQITTAFTHVAGSNQAAAAAEGSAYQTTLTPDTGYEITTVSVTMGGTDITATAYDSATGTISIAQVTGAIAITGTAEVINNALGAGKLGQMRLGTRNA